MLKNNLFFQFYYKFATAIKNGTEIAKHSAGSRVELLLTTKVLNSKSQTMKKLLITLSASLFMAFVSFGQNAVEVSQPDNPNAPVITFEKTTHDYGTITKGADGQCEFKFKNTGVEPLILSNAASSCGCTVPEWPREPILKGKSASIKVKYDTNRIGAINKTVTITSNAKNGPVQLRIIGNVVEKVEGQGMPEKTTGAAPIAK